MPLNEPSECRTFSTPHYSKALFKPKSKNVKFEGEVVLQALHVFDGDGMLFLIHVVDVLPLLSHVSVYVRFRASDSR